jgi:hypothetical protein
VTAIADVGSQAFGIARERRPTYPFVKTYRAAACPRPVTAPQRLGERHSRLRTASRASPHQPVEGVPSSTITTLAITRLPDGGSVGGSRRVEDRAAL